MKKNVITLLSLLLLVSMLLISCNGGKNDPIVTEPQGSTPSGNQTDPVEQTPGLEPVAYDETIRILQREDREREEWDPEGEGFTILEEAMVKRNRYLMEKYSVDFEYTYCALTKTTAEIQVPVLANTYICDFITYAPNFTATLAQNGALRTIQSIPNIDLSNPWWYQNLNDALSYRDTNYFAIGSANLFTLWRASCVYYNSSLAASIGYTQDYFYDLVTNHQWTLEALVAAAEECNYIDNGVKGASKEDRYAISHPIGGWYANFYGTGMSFTGRDEDGRWKLSELTAGDEHILNRLSDMIELVNNEEITLPLDAGVDQWFFFRDGNAMFLEEAICVYNAFKDSTLEYGILPSPLLAEGQQEYYTTFHKQHSTAIAVPISVDNSRLEMVGCIIEDATWQAQKVQWPAFYDTLLKGRAAQNPESAEMIEYIFANVVIDPAILYVGEVDTAVRSLIQNNDADSIITTMNPALAQAQLGMNKIMDAIDKLLDGE